MNSSDQIEKPSPASSPLQIQLSAAFVHKICASLREFGTGASAPLSGRDGILFGSLNGGLLTVGAFEPFQGQPVDGKPLPKPEEGDLAIQQFVADSLAHATTDATQMVGWYSIRSFASPGLTPRDIDFHNRYFQHASCIGLVFTPQGTENALLELYSRVQGGPLCAQDRCSGRRWLDFERDSVTTAPLALTIQSEDANFPYARVYEVLSSLETKSIPEPFAIAAPAQAVRRKLLSISTAALVLMTAGLAFGWLHARANVQRAKVQSVAVATPVAAPLPSETGIGMNVQSQGDRLLIRWNRQLPEVRTAKGGMLVIHDGVQRRRVTLDAADIENGSVLYRPQSNDVSLALDLLTQRGSVLTGHLRVLDGTRQENSAPLYAVRVTPALHVPRSAATHSNPPLGTKQVVPPTARQLKAAPSLSSPSLDTRTEPERSDHAKTGTHPDLASISQKAPVLWNLSTTAPPTKTVISDGQHSAKAGMSPAEPDLRLQKTTTPQKAATSQTARELPPAPALGSGTVPAITNKPDPKSGLGFIQPVPIKQVMPVTRLFGASTIYDAKEVTVKVAIDNQGHVTHAEALNTGRKSAGLLTWAALAAARQWTFQPATIRGVRVASEHTIVFHFAGRTH
jgi:hypothetical protein